MSPTREILFNDEEFNFADSSMIEISR